MRRARLGEGWRGAAWERMVAELRGDAPPVQPMSAALPSAAESLLGALDLAFDREARLRERLAEMWGAPTPLEARVALLRGIRAGLTAHPDDVDRFDRFVRDRLTAADVARVVPATPRAAPSASPPPP